MDDNDQELVERAKEGDLPAFEVLYRSYVRQVYGVCRRLLDSDQDAEDMTQKVFLRAWRRLDGFRGASSLGTWLRRIAVNLVIDERRSAFRQMLRSSTDDELMTQPAKSSAPGEIIDLERAVEQLPPGPRRVLVLHDIEGFTHAEVAALLGVTVGTTKTQLFRARKALRESLQ